MINLQVDESYAIDYLAILDVKHRLDSKNTEKAKNFFACLKFIDCQIQNLEEIMASEEYKLCYVANMETFEAVDKAKTDAVPASFVDRCNFKRYQAKQTIQRKFFNGEITEVKIGYEIYKEQK